MLQSDDKDDFSIENTLLIWIILLVHYFNSKKRMHAYSFCCLCHAYGRLSLEVCIAVSSIHSLRLSGGAMVLGKLLVQECPTAWVIVGQGPTALAVAADFGCLDVFTLIYPFFPPSPSLWESARQTQNSQPTISYFHFYH